MKIFALKLTGTKDYVSLESDDTNNLVIRNYEVLTPEMFEQVPAPGSSSYLTIICIRSVFNRRFFNIEDSDNFILKGFDHINLINTFFQLDFS